MPADIHCGKCQQRQIITASGLVCQCGVRPLDGHARKALAREYPEQVSKSPLDAEVFRNNAMGREHAR